MLSYSAPGSLMIMGEHAVLRGHHAITASINQRLKITLFPKPASDQIRIQSSIGNYQSSIHQLIDEPKLDYAITIIKAYLDQLASGFDLQIESGIHHEYGLGSSAALCIALHACMHHWVHGEAATHKQLLDAAKQTIISLKGSGSGCDCAASLYGGCLLLNTKKQLIKGLSALPPLSVIYSGHKTPTHQVIRMMPTESHSNDQQINQLTLDAANAIENTNWELLGKLMCEQHALMVAMGLSTPAIDQIADDLKTTDGMMGYKISGSGLGDCMIALNPTGTSLTLQHPDTMVLPVHLDTEGLRYES